MNEHSALILTKRPTIQQRGRRNEIEDILKDRLTGFHETEDERMAMQAVAEIQKDKRKTDSTEDRKKALQSKIRQRLKVRQGKT